MKKEDIKTKLKSASFWLALSGVVIMLIQGLGVKIATEEAQAAINSVAAALVMLGILNSPKSGKEVENAEEAEEKGENNE
ncbi:MAG TPA: hypothetical protein P5161_01915 [Eubacteriales bacterium]|jgi:uncharacterized membrane protein|nr:hypothetical protein [Clostridia bacterium]HRR89521.1 hypothetical protein [Eubacteriales bacterium]HRU84766.1 hypothetical protein [Eubacteriales bacterium]